MATVNPRLIAMSLAHGLSPGMISTWHDSIARTPRVMVPVQLDALVVRQAGGVWADCKMDAPQDPKADPVPAHTLLKAPFAELSAPRPPGVYLHWALPDALTRGAGTAASNSVSFPAIPDRWLVVRISTAKGDARRAVTGWVIVADTNEPTVTALDSWTEAQDPDQTRADGNQPLTALGIGDAGWSAYFDNVENRLGFYDNLSGAIGPLAYLVCGWHSRHGDDPIGEGLSTKTEFEARLDQLGWEINPADIEGAFVYAQQRVEAATSIGLSTREAVFMQTTSAATGKSYTPAGVTGEKSTLFTSPGLAQYGTYFARAVSWPEFTLYHGGIVGIGWPTGGVPVAPKGLLGGDAGGPPQASSVKVAIGNTLTEALAATLASNDGSPDEARILEAVLLGATQELDEPDAPARIDTRLHASGFGSLPGGETTEPITQQAPSTPMSVTPDPSSTDPGIFAKNAVPPVASDTTSIIPKLEASVKANATEPFIVRNSPAIGRGAFNSVLSEAKQFVVQEVGVKVPRTANSDAPATTIDAKRALPRFFVPADPVFLLQGAGRSVRHGGDSSYSESSNLVCRLSGHTVEDMTPVALRERLRGASIRGADILQRGVDHGGVPVECDDLLRELALLDPGSATAVASAAAALTGGAALAANAAFVGTGVATLIATEQTAWWVSRDDRRDIAPLLSASGFGGTLPNPVAISLPIDPWTPLHLDWAIELFEAADLTTWQLHEIDFDAVPETLPNSDTKPTRTLSGRALLNGGAAKVAASTVRTVLEQASKTGSSEALRPGSVRAYNSMAAKEMIAAVSELKVQAMQFAVATTADAATAAAPAVSASDQPALDHIADTLDKMDVLVGAMDRFNSKLRADFVADGVSKPAPDQPVPGDFWPLRAGFMRVTRLRLVDCFGQVLDLLGSSDTQAADTSQLIRSEPLTVSDRPDLIELAPRFTAPTRLWFRYMSASDDTLEANDATSPLCGFVLPNHLDGDMQFHDDVGTGLGAVRFDALSGVVWEDSPGSPTNVGSLPETAVKNPHLAGIAQGLLDWGAVDATPDAPAVDTALSSLLRIVDATLWSVDPFGHIGDEHLALLVGHPIAVMRALVRVEVEEPVTPDIVRGMRVPVRIGALAHWQDGLLGYFVDDDYRTLHISDPASADFARPIGPNQGFNQQASQTSDYYANFAADLGVLAQPGATPVNHPYVDTSGVLWIQPDQDVMLTLLVEPHSAVHATTGYLPRKDIGMRRAWVAPGLAKLAPVFRFGPVMVDPKLIRMPVASDIHGTWSWSHRQDASTWADDPVTNSNGDARIPPDPSVGQEGWLRLTPDEPIA